MERQKCQKNKKTWSREHASLVCHQQRANLHLPSMMFKCRLETSFRDNLWTPELTGVRVEGVRGGERVTRSPAQLIPETVAAQQGLCLPHTAPSINKPSARGYETIWTWTSEDDSNFSPLAHRCGCLSASSSAKPSHMIGSDWLLSCTMMRDKEGGLPRVWKVNASFGCRRAHTV